MRNNRLLTAFCLHQFGQDLGVEDGQHLPEWDRVFSSVIWMYDQACASSGRSAGSEWWSRAAMGRAVLWSAAPAAAARSAYWQRKSAPGCCHAAVWRAPAGMDAILRSLSTRGSICWVFAGVFIAYRSEARIIVSPPHIGGYSAEYNIHQYRGGTVRPHLSMSLASDLHPEPAAWPGMDLPRLRLATVSQNLDR